MKPRPLVSHSARREPSAHAPHADYRPDIDGLRAVAVLAVVGYHAFPSSVTGGLIGVDIFFVISGYLISTIILKGLLAGRFSYLDFYARRVRRIFPALAVVLLTCLAVGWFALYDIEYQPLAHHVTGGAAFVSNFVLSSESGYFDSQSEFKQLLHLWSLGIEEQFYLVFPLVLALCWAKMRSLLPVIGGLLIASLAMNLWLIGVEPAATFYLPFTRFWELMIGALLAYAAHVAPIHRWRRAGHAAGELGPTAAEGSRARSEVCAWAGALLILAALAFISRESAFPGWLALLPTLGALLLIAAGPAASINRYVLASRPFVFVGLISYPLYLWHWPILSFQRILSPESPGRLGRALAVLLSFVLAWMTYRLLEKPIRSFSKARVAVILCAVMLAIGLAGLYVDRHFGLASRSANVRNAAGRKMLVDSLALDARIRNTLYKTHSCSFLGQSDIPAEWCASYGPDDARTIVLWGDSHASAWSPVLFKIAEAHQLRVVRFYVGGCPPLVGTRRIDAIFASAPCASFGQGEQVIKAIKSLSPTQIFLAARWSLYTPSKVAAVGTEVVDAGSSSTRVLEPQLKKTLLALPPDIPITIFRTAPVLEGEPQRALLRHARIETSSESYRRQESEANRAIDAAVASRSNVRVFDPGDLLCEKLCNVVQNGTVLYSNATHLSAQGALLAFDALSSGYLR